MSKKIFRRVITATMAAALMVTSIGGIAPGTKSNVKTASAAKVKKSGDFKYVKYRNGVKIARYTGKAKKVTIPGKIAGKKVIAIESNTFEQNDTVKQIKIPDSVKEIGSYAFADCIKLKKVTMPKELEEIGEGAFVGSAITKIKIPDGIKKIEPRTFDNCQKLKEVTLSEDVKIIGRSAFANCEKLASINLENIEEIGVEAFENNKSITGALSLNNIVTLGTEAFYGCSGITAVSFSDTLQMLGEREAYFSAPIAVGTTRVSGDTSANPFAYCSNIEKFEVDVNNANYNSVDGVIYGKTNEWIVAYPAKKGGIVNVPENVKGISEYAFSGAQMSQINMGMGLKTIGTEAFGGCTATKVTMPFAEGEGVYWKKDAFLECKSLKKVIFPKGIKNANNVAFINCSSLTEVVLPEGMEWLSDEMFFGCTALETVTLPKEVTRIPIGCFYGCKSLKNVNFENVDYISALSFYGCEALSGVLNLNATRIKTAAFGNCTGITEVNFNNPVKEFIVQWFELEEMGADGTSDFYGEFHDDRAMIDESERRFVYNSDFNSSIVANPFAGCSKLTKINVLNENGSNVKSVEGVLFTSDMQRLISYPAGLTGKYNIPYGVVRIENSAFEGAAVSEVVMSNTVVNVNAYAFYKSKIKSLTISKSATVFNNILTSFEGCSELEEIKVHAGNGLYESIDGVLCSKVYSKSVKRRILVYPALKKGKTFKIPEKTSISQGAFDNCKYLKKVYMADMKKYDNTENEYFKNCKKIKLYLPKSFSIKNLTAPETGKFSYGFGYGCTGCKTYIVKGSAFAKKLAKKKIKYNKF